MFYSIAVLKNFAKFAAKHLREKKREVLWIHACLYVRPPVRTTGIVHYFFCEILHSNRNLEVVESARRRFSRTVLVCLKIGKKGPRWPQSRVFLSCHKIFSLFFAGNNQFSVFACKPHIWESSASQVIAQSTLIQSDHWIFRSSVSLERIRRYLWFFGWWYS